MHIIISILQDNNDTRNYLITRLDIMLMQHLSLQREKHH